MIQNASSWQGTTDIDDLSHLAIEAALSSDWIEATKINQKILTLSSDNVEALNRLAKALMCAGEIEKAQKTYKKVLEVDPYNIIARKNIEKISKLTNGATTISNKASGQTIKNMNSNGHVNLSTVFLFEPGKTKTINLLNLASPPILAALNCGDTLQIVPKKHAISIATQEGIYLGALPDDTSHKMIVYIQGGNKYEAFVKSATTKSLTIFIREVERSAKFATQPSFQEARTISEDKETFFA
ncbi:MAG: tetratricopeptide repeat protein [Patescibacteria group bacterium]